VASTCVQIPASDGFLLNANIFPAADPYRGVVLIHSGTAVPQKFYGGFAEYLAQMGFETITYDYRGIAASAPPRLQGFQASMRDWALKDAEGVQLWARRTYPDKPLLAVGHSFGGNVIGLCDSTRHLTAAALIAGHAGCLRFIMPWRERLRVYIMVKGLFPLINAVLGYVPSRRLGFGEDLPREAARDWVHWSSLPNCFFDVADLDAPRRFARVQLPLVSISLDDDLWATAPAVDLMMSYFVRARLEHWKICSEREDTGPIGHLGYFRRRHGLILWPRLAEWLCRQAESVE
jgi:predicted alpha/beta hydrolase